MSAVYGLTVDFLCTFSDLLIIIITYPEQETVDKMVIVQAADEWKDKCDHWNDYCTKQKARQIRPMLVIQVENSSGENAAATEIGDCLSRIEKRTGAQFREHEAVHTFGKTADIYANGVKICHVDAADNADNRKIRMVFFENPCGVFQGKSLCRLGLSPIKLASLIKNTDLDPCALQTIRQDGVNMINAYIQTLKDSGEYGTMAADAKKLNLSCARMTAESARKRYDDIVSKRKRRCHNIADTSNSLPKKNRLINVPTTAL